MSETVNATSTPVAPVEGADLYANRRKQLMERLGENAVALVLANPAHKRSNDSCFG